MRIRNRTRNTLLGTRVAQADSWWSRLRGFIGRDEPRQGEGLLLVNCNAIHTWWMRFDLDVLFLDNRGRVLKMHRSLRPWRMTRRVRGAHYVLEVPSGTIDMSGTQVGDELAWGDPVPYTISVLSSPEAVPPPTSKIKRSGT
jgi:uncharacterized membrane protein (UPF0127 family)